MGRNFKQQYDYFINEKVFEDVGITVIDKQYFHKIAVVNEYRVAIKVRSSILLQSSIRL